MLSELVADMLETPRARVKDYLRGEFVDRIVRQGHCRGRNWAYITYALLVLELWLREMA